VRGANPGAARNRRSPRPRQQDKDAGTADYEARSKGCGGEAGLTAWLYLVLAHLVADFMLQPYELVQLKRRPIGLAIHAGIHLLMTAAVVAPFLPRWWIIVPLSAAIHYLIDRWKVDSRHTEGPTSLVMFLLDQALHLGALALVLLIAGLPLGREVGYGSDGLVRAMYYAVPYVAATFAGAILVYQVAVAFRTRPNPSDLLTFGPRAAGLIQRALVLTLVLFAGPSWWWLGAVPFAIVWNRNGRGGGQLAEAIAGFGFAVVLGLLFR